MCRHKFVVPLIATALVAACESSPTSPPSPTTTGITLSQSSATVGRNTTLNLAATAQSSNCGTADVTPQAVWTSSNEAVATVSGGVVSVKSLGSAQITASYQGQSAVSTITGRRRTHFDGRFTVRDLSGSFTVGALTILLDNTQIANVGPSGWDDDVTVEINATSNIRPIEPGPRALALAVETVAGSHQLRVGSTSVTIFDVDTNEALTVIALSQKTATLSSGGRFNWTLDVPVFTQ